MRIIPANMASISPPSAEPDLPQACAVLQGSCGYFGLDKSQFPFWSVAAFSTSNRFFKAEPLSACGWGPCPSVPLAAAFRCSLDTDIMSCMFQAC